MFALYRLRLKGSKTNFPHPKQYVIVSIDLLNTRPINIGEKPTLYSAKCLAQRDADMLNSLPSYIISYFYAIAKYPC